MAETPKPSEHGIFDARAVFKSAFDGTVSALGGISLVRIDSVHAEPGTASPSAVDLEAVGCDDPGTASAVPHRSAPPPFLAEATRLLALGVAWTLAMAALVEAAVESGRAACLLEAESTSFVAVAFIVQAIMSCTDKMTALTRGVSAYCLACVFMVVGDTLPAAMRQSLILQLARAVASLLFYSEAVCAMAAHSPEWWFGAHVRRFGGVLAVVRASALVFARRGTSPVHVALGIAEPLWLCALCWSHWRGGRVGRRTWLWAYMCAGFAAMAFGRALEIPGDEWIGSLGALCFRHGGLLCTAAVYGRLAAWHIIGEARLSFGCSADEP